MSFFQDYNGFINIFLAIALAVFLFKKLKSIAYINFTREFIIAIANLLREGLKIKNRISNKEKFKNFYYDLPDLDIKVFGINFLILYSGCCTISLVDILAGKSKFNLKEFFIDDPITYIFLFFFLIVFYFFLKFLIDIANSVKSSRGQGEGFFDRLNTKVNSNLKAGKAPSSYRTPKKETSTIDNSSSYSQPKQEKIKEETIMQPNMKQESTARAICANCAFWTGQASLKSAAGNFIEYADSKAACMPNGGRPNIEMLPLATCNKFSKRW